MNESGRRTFRNCPVGRRQQAGRRWRRLDAPYITLLIERQPQQPELFVLSQGNTVHYPSSNVSAYGKALQAHRHSNFQGTREPYRASLGIHQDYQACAGKRLGRTEACESDRDLARNSSTPAEATFLVCGTHIQVYRFATARQRPWPVFRDLIVSAQF